MITTKELADLVLKQMNEIADHVLEDPYARSSIIVGYYVKEGQKVRQQLLALAAKEDEL